MVWPCGEGRDKPCVDWGILYLILGTECCQPRRVKQKSFYLWKSLTVSFQCHWLIVKNDSLKRYTRIKTYHRFVFQPRMMTLIITNRYRQHVVFFSKFNLTQSSSCLSLLFSLQLNLAHKLADFFSKFVISVYWFYLERQSQHASLRTFSLRAPDK